MSRRKKLLLLRKQNKKIFKNAGNEIQAWLTLGMAYGKATHYENARHCFEHVLELQPSAFDALTGLGLIFMRLGDFNQAIATFKTALSINPAHITTLVDTGVAYARLDQLSRAREYFERVVELDANNPMALGNLANVLAYQGEADQAVVMYRRALALNKHADSVYSNFLLCLHYPSSYDPETTYVEHKTWGEFQRRISAKTSAFKNDRGAGRKLKIGYLTPDLRNHSVMYFFKPLLTKYTRDAFEIYCYVELSKLDETIKKLCDEASVTVRSTVNNSDEQVASMIRGDQIDILVDLAGHTDGSRLKVMAWKPAPVQVTYLGYPDTTGLDTVDYRLTDAIADPPGETEHLHTEPLMRFDNGFLCFSPPSESPEVSPLPCINNGYITFGSFNVLTKINKEIISSWAAILKKIDGARLLIKNKQFSDSLTRDRFTAVMGEYGISSSRLELIGTLPKAKHMASYSMVDISLDTYPYNGTTTTCDSLWMGVPVITRSGSSHVSRVGASILTSVGLPNLVASSQQEYVELAVNLAKNKEQLTLISSTLRTRMATSVCDGERFIRELESMYQTMWQRR